MRRFKNPSNGGLFHRGEWLRILSMVMMLVILYTMIQRARDASVWRWLVNDSSLESASATDVIVANRPDSDSTGLFDGPTDSDPDEIDAAHELFGAISDKNKLSVEEMPAYWRLWRWTRAQSLETLQQRARRDVSLGHFLETPDELRGHVVRLRLHLRQSVSWKIGPEEKAGGAKLVYEAWGWSDESPNFYCIVFTQPPPDMPIGPSVWDEVTFCGYFLKLISYRDQEDKLRVAPLLIGRVARHALPPVGTDEVPWAWAMLGAGGLVLLVLLVRWTRAYAFPRSRAKPVDRQMARASIAQWLETNADSAESNPEINAQIGRTFPSDHSGPTDHKWP